MKNKDKVFLILLVSIFMVGSAVFGASLVRNDCCNEIKQMKGDIELVHYEMLMLRGEYI